MTKYVYMIFILLGISIITSCVREDLPEPEPVGLQEGYIKILLSAPDLRTPQRGTRAMSDFAERVIDQDLLNILVFKYSEDGSGNVTETFFYNAPIRGSIVYDDIDGRKAIVTVRLIKSESSNDRYTIAIIANHDLSSVSMIEDVTTKAEIFEQLIYSLPGQWNADTEFYTPFPMWGETTPISVDENTASQTVDLYRALARVDVGLNFIADGSRLTEQADGVDGFKLKEVHVYRTYDRGYVAPLSPDFLINPNVPAAAARHDDNSPLSYTIPNAAGADSYVREIYLPEASLPPSPANNNMHCLVIGGYYEGSSSVTYYRLDFATESGAGIKDFMPILRNFRYVFNIIQVRGPGSATPDAALQSIATVANINYDLLVWDETIHEMEVQGKYYFGLDNRDLLFEATSTATDMTNVRTINYQTNYPLSAADPVTFSWKSTTDNPSASPAFAAQWNAGSQSINITANINNETNTVLSDTLFVHAGPFTMAVAVYQNYVNFKFALDCSTVTVNGVYSNGTVLNPANHYITLSIVAEDRSLQDYPYVIETSDPGNHGIYFRAEGVFDFRGIPEGNPLRVNNIRLIGNGTLTAADGEQLFSLAIVSNSSTGSSCEATIQLATPTMNILVLSEITNLHGYAISRTQGGAGQVVGSRNNFGPNDNSIVKVGGFNFISSSTYDFSSSSTSDPYKWVTGIGNNNQIADIVYIAYPASFGNATAQLLVNYLDRGGVIVAFLESASSSLYLANNLFGTTFPTNGITGIAGSIYPFPAHSTFGLDAESLNNVLRQYEGDPILNGPFGDIRDKQWGEDASNTAYVNLTSALSNPSLTVYSTYRDISTTGPLNNPNYTLAYKYESENRNIVWFGDGGAMSSGYSGVVGIPLVGNTVCPFYWDTNNYFPIPKPAYGWSINNWPVYNSTMFCNVMAWAIRKSDSLRTKRGG